MWIIHSSCGQQLRLFLWIYRVFVHTHLAEKTCSNAFNSNSAQLKTARRLRVRLDDMELRQLRLNWDALLCLFTLCFFCTAISHHQRRVKKTKKLLCRRKVVKNKKKSLNINWFRLNQHKLIYDRASTADESCEQRQSILRFNTPDINKKQRKKNRRNTPIVRRKSSFTIHRKCVKLQADEYHLKAENSKKKRQRKYQNSSKKKLCVFFSVMMMMSWKLKSVYKWQKEWKKSVRKINKSKKHSGNYTRKVFYVKKR